MKKLFALVLVGTVTSCAALKAAEQPIIDFADAECEQVSGPNENQIVRLVCDVVNLAGDVIQTFTMDVKKDDVQNVLSTHPVKAGHPHPSVAKGSP